MNPNNLEQAKILCYKLEQLRLHERDFVGIQNSALPVDQFNRMQEYAQRLSKDIKTLEKQIAEL